MVAVSRLTLSLAWERAWHHALAYDQMPATTMSSLGVRMSSRPENTALTCTPSQILACNSTALLWNWPEAGACALMLQSCIH